MSQNRRKRDRLTPAEPLTVYDLTSQTIMGRLINLSADGAMLVTREPVKSATTFSMRISLPQEILGHEDITVSAECRWCRKNIEADRWESGYELKVTGIDAEILEYLLLGFKICGWGEPGVSDVHTTELENRRRSVRYELLHPLEVYEFDNYRQIGELVDLSIDGMRLLSRKPIDQDSSFACRIKLTKPIFQSDYLIVSATCMWCRPLAGTTQFESGYRLTNISRKDAAVLLHLLIYYAKPQATRKRIQVLE